MWKTSISSLIRKTKPDYMNNYMNDSENNELFTQLPEDFDPEQDEIIESIVIDNMDLDDRTRARGIALQSLYEMDMSDHPINLILKERIDSVQLEDLQKEFVEKIVTGVRPFVHQIDRLIADYAPEWPVDQIAVIDRNIIRISVWEFAIGKTTPIKVAINESVELAKLFGSESSPRFVNGVLGSIADHIDELNHQ